MFSKKFKISNIQVSDFNKSLVIAEIGINHEGNFSKCIKMIQEAKKCGADLVKLQIVDPESNYEKETKSYKIFKKSNLSNEKIFKIYNFCKKKKIKIFSTFDRKNFEFFRKINQICYKISSSLFYDYYFIKEILKSQKPVLISSGVSDINDIDVLLNLLKKEKNKKIALLHCRSLYPTNISKLNLSRISHLKSKYGLITGFSDHTLGLSAPVASIHYGAKIIEKHFTLDSKRKNFDHQISLEPKMFKLMVNKIRENEKMIGKFDYKINENSKDFDQLKKVIRSFQISKDIKKNTLLKSQDFKLIRTNKSKNIFKFDKLILKILKKKTSKNLKAGKFLSLSSFKK